MLTSPVYVSAQPCSGASTSAKMKALCQFLLVDLVVCLVCSWTTHGGGHLAQQWQSLICPSRVQSLKPLSLRTGLRCSVQVELAAEDEGKDLPPSVMNPLTGQASVQTRDGADPPAGASEATSSPDTEPLQSTALVLQRSRGVFPWWKVRVGGHTKCIHVRPWQWPRSTHMHVPHATQIQQILDVKQNTQAH